MLKPLECKSLPQPSPQFSSFFAVIGVIQVQFPSGAIWKAD